MKFRLCIFALFGASLLAVLSAARVAPSNPNGIATATARQTFEAKGRICGLEAGTKTVRIAHEDIPLYMPARTMSFTVKDPAVLGGLAVGDAVKFQLAATDADSWISRIEKISDDCPVPAGMGPDPGQASATEPVRVGEKVPNFTLTDQDGHRIQLGDLRGKAVLMTFVYTRCPLPKYCRLMSKNFASLQESLAREFHEGFRLLSVSIDPQYDRPLVLKHYAARHDADERLWTLGTGTAEQIEFVADSLGLTYEARNGHITHDLRTALIGPDGKLIHVWEGNAWTPFEVQRIVRATLTGETDVAAR